MNVYKNSGGDSGVRSYELGSDSILVMFNDLSIYEYTSASVGYNNLALMKRMASQGSGLNSFINRNVKYNYSRRVS